MAQLVHAQEDPDDPVTLEVGPGILYHHLTGLLNALSKRRLRNIVMAERKRGGNSGGRSNRKRKTRPGKTVDRRNNEGPDFDPLTADTTIQRTDT